MLNREQKSPHLSKQMWAFKWPGGHLGSKKSTLMKGAVTVLFGFGCKFEHIQFNTSVFTLKEQNHANFVPEMCQLFARLSGR